MRNKKQESIAHHKVVANDEAKILAAQLAKVEVTVKVRMGEEGRVFGSVTAKDISDAAKAQYKVDIDKKKIEIKRTIENIGCTWCTRSCSSWNYKYYQG